MRCSRSSDLAGDEGQQFGEGGLHGAVRDQALLVQLRRTDFGELAEARDQRAQVLLVLRGQAHRRRLFHLRIPGDHAGIDAIGLFQPPHALGKLAHRARVEDGRRQTGFRQLRKGLLLVAAGGFHGHQFHLVLTTEDRQRGDAFRVVGERRRGALPADAGFQRIRRNIHSTNDPCHGNLPCMCDRSHATVRSCVTWAAVPGLSDGG